jgi:hypothetical protein
VSAFFGEAPSVSFADAVGGAGDDGDFVFQAHETSIATDRR